MERWGENSLSVKGSLVWASLPPTNNYQRGWVQRGGKGNTVSTVTPEKLLPSASPSHCLLGKHTEVLVLPQTLLLLWEGRGGSVETRGKSSLGSLSNEKEVLLAGTRHSQEGTGSAWLKRNGIPQWCLEVSTRNSPYRHPYGPNHSNDLHGEPWTTCQDNAVTATWMGEQNHSSVIQEAMRMVWAYAPQDL